VYIRQRHALRQRFPSVNIVLDQQLVYIYYAVSDVTDRRLPWDGIAVTHLRGSFALLYLILLQATIHDHTRTLTTDQTVE